MSLVTIWASGHSESGHSRHPIRSLQIVSKTWTKHFNRPWDTGIEARDFGRDELGLTCIDDPTGSTMPKTQSAIHAQSRRRDNQGENDAGPSRPRPKPYEQRDASGLPGVSKLKASIRQTRRFLAKVNTDVRKHEYRQTVRGPD